MENHKLNGKQLIYEKYSWIIFTDDFITIRIDSRCNNSRSCTECEYLDSYSYQYQVCLLFRGISEQRNRRFVCTTVTVCRNRELVCGGEMPM